MSNPFSDLDSFEALRAAALKGQDAFALYSRREAAAARRRVAQFVEVRLTRRVQRMIDVAVASSRAVLLVGPPGTGKTQIIEQLVEKVDHDPHRYGLASDSVDAAWVTPEEEWTFDRVVLGETVVDGELTSVEGDLLEAIRYNRWLVLDETNRADMDRVLGGVLTWLSGKRVRVGTWRDEKADPRPVFLDWSDQPRSGLTISDTVGGPIVYAAGYDWRLLGTYNAVDAQRVFRMGQALSRRFKHVPVPPASLSDFRQILAASVTDERLLEALVARVSALYGAHLRTADAQLGPGLFTDIPAYIEHGIRMNGEQEGRDPNSEEPVDDEASIGPELFEELLAEGYLISVGNILAKYEDYVLQQLGEEITRVGAVSEASWQWIVESLQSMRA